MECKELENKQACPCPNLACERRGYCCQCTASHLSHKSLNACGFYSIKDFLLEAVAASPDSPNAAVLKQFVEKREAGYAKRRTEHGLSEPAL